MTKKPVSKKKTTQRSVLSRFWAHTWLRRLSVLLVGLFLLLCVLLWQGLFRAIPMQTASQIMTIKTGQTYLGLIDQLHAKGQLRLPVIAKIYQRLFVIKSLKAGVYEVKKGTDVRTLLSLLGDGKLAQMNRILVIEGTTFEQLRQRLDQDKDVTHTLTGLDNTALLKQLAIPVSHPEGWFAPDTYYFSKGESDAVILTHLYKAQRRIVDAAWENRADNLPYKNAYEALIMASIVEKETGLQHERQDVAGVFVRRLNIGMRLQTDPTVIYGMGKRYQGNIRRKDLQTPTAYNTYTINGLPPTPIALPSKASIEAALHPADGKSLYFVATGKGGHTFSENLEQHNRAVSEYLKVLRQSRNNGY